MDEQKINVTEQEALIIIIQELRNRKINILKKDTYKNDLGNDNICIEIRTAHYSGWVTKSSEEFDKVNINLYTPSYPTVRRRFKNFDVKNGNYASLTEKIKFIINEDKKLKQQKEIKENNEKKNLEILKDKLQGLKARKEQYGDNLIIKTKYFKVSFSATDVGINVDIEDNRGMTVEQAIELIKKLQ